MSKYETVTVKLTGTDGNAFAIMGAVSKALRKAGASADEVEQYMNESMSGDYDNLLRTAMKWVNVE
jgi:ribosomal protein S9